MPLIWRLLLLFSGSIAMASAHEHCWQPGMTWSCVGVVELDSTRVGTVERRKLVRFNGGEVLAEVERKGLRSRALTVKPSGLTLYQGVDDLKTANSPQGPFMFFSESIGWGALLPLHTAYPSGPESVPDGSAEKEIVIDNVRLNLHTTRVTGDQIKFRWKIADAEGFAEGRWDRNQPERWPNELTIRDWKHDGPQSISNLSEARSMGSTR
jgi:hypothetical protein